MGDFKNWRDNFEMGGLIPLYRLCFFSCIDHLLCLCAWFLILFHVTQMRFSQSTHLNAFVFGDFDIHHKDWLTYAGGTEQICLLFCISFFLLILVFVLQQLSIHWEILIMLLSQSVSTDFSSYSQQDALFHRIAYDHFPADWDSICDHVRCSMGRYI